jgi:hypothetical protein
VSRLLRRHNKNIKDAFDGTTRPLRLCGKVEGTNMQKLASFIGAIALSSLLFSVTIV